jgi:regulator of sirC expression with transglutaminase-like and TPR domain
MSAPLQPLRCRPECYRAFGAELTRLQEPGALLRAAASVSLHEHPGADLDLVERRVEMLAADVRARGLGRSAKARLAHLHAVLFDEQGFRGEEQGYSNPSNSYLPTVLATKRGLPITLSLLYVEVARRAGIPAFGLDVPAHFVVEVDEPGGTLVVDPFHGGRTVTRDELAERLDRVVGPSWRTNAPLARATSRGWLDRILRNLEASFVRAARLDDYAAMGELRALLGTKPGEKSATAGG